MKKEKKRGWEGPVLEELPDVDGSVGVVAGGVVGVDGDSVAEFEGRLLIPEVSVGGAGEVSFGFTVDGDGVVVDGVVDPVLDVLIGVGRGAVLGAAGVVIVDIDRSSGGSMLGVCGCGCTYD